MKYETNIFGERNMSRAALLTAGRVSRLSASQNRRGEKNPIFYNIS